MDVKEEAEQCGLDFPPRIEKNIFFVRLHMTRAAAFSSHELQISMHDDVLRDCRAVGERQQQKRNQARSAFPFS